MIQHDFTMRTIAENLNISQQGVWNRLSGRIASKRIDAEIARISGMKPEEIKTIINHDQEAAVNAE